MKKMIQTIMGYKYKKDLDKLEYSLTHSAFFNDFNETGYKKQIKEIEHLYDKLPLGFKINKLSSINRYIDSTTTDEPILYSNYDRTNMSYNIIIKTYLLNIIEKEKLTKDEKETVFNAVKQYMSQGKKDELATALNYFILDDKLDAKTSGGKANKI